MYPLIHSFTCQRKVLPVQAMKAHMGMMHSVSLDLVIRREWSASRSGRVTHETHCLLGSVSTRTVLDVLEKGSFVTLAGDRTTIPRSSIPYSSHYADRAIPLPFFYYSF